MALKRKDPIELEEFKKRLNEDRKIRDKVLGKGSKEKPFSDNETKKILEKSKRRPAREEEELKKRLKEDREIINKVLGKKPKGNKEADQKLIQDHYKNPSVKKIIMDHAKEGNLWRAGNGDFVDWYMKGKDTARLYVLPNLYDYDYLTTHHRTLYWTLNFFDERIQECSIPRSLHDENGNKLTIGTFADTRTYSLGTDIDSGKGYNIMQAKVREAVESLAQFMADKFRETCPVSTHALFSCGGIYLLLHQNLFTEKFKTDENSDLSWRILVDCFNAYIKDIETQFFEKYPEYKRMVKADAINNQKRVFKTILSVHKDYPLACIPLDVKNIKIDIKKARLPLSDETINECKEWMKEYDVKERKPLLLKLKKYENQCKPFDDDTLARVKVLVVPADRRYWPPCIKKVIILENVPNGATRMKTLYATFIGQVGYSEKESEKSFKEVSNRLGGPDTNIFESWFRKMSCPTCKTIQNKGGGFPHMNMGELGICQPDETCKEIANPVEYAQKKRIKNMTTFSLTVKGKVYHINFKKTSSQGKPYNERVLYYLMDGKKKGLETETTIDFYKNDDKRKAFYKNIINAIGEKDKRKIEQIKKELADILTQIQESNILGVSGYQTGFKYVNMQKKQLLGEKKPKEQKKVTLEDVYNVVEKWLGIKIKDRNRIDVLLATVLSNKIPGTPIWILIVGASGDWKTTFCRALRGIPIVIEIDQITKNTLASGHKDATDLGSELDHSSHILLFLDMASLTSANKDDKNLIWGQFRNLYDSFINKRTGNDVTRKYDDCHVTMIACTTPTIRNELLIHAQLGTRELMYNTDADPIDNDFKMNKALENEKYEEEMHKEMQEVVTNFWNCHDIKEIEPNNEMLNFLKSESERLAILRATGTVDRTYKELLNPIDPEVPTRLIKQFIRIYRCLKSLADDYPDEKVKEIISHIVDSSGDRVRQMVLELLQRKPKEEFKIVDVQQHTRLGRKAVKAQLEMLWNLKMLDKRTVFERVGSVTRINQYTGVEEQVGGKVEEISYYSTGDHSISNRLEGVTPHSPPTHASQTPINNIEHEDVHIYTRGGSMGQPLYKETHRKRCRY